MSQAIWPQSLSKPDSAKDQAYNQDVARQVIEYIHEKAISSLERWPEEWHVQIREAQKRQAELIVETFKEAKQPGLAKIIEDFAKDPKNNKERALTAIGKPPQTSFEDRFLQAELRNQGERFKAEDRERNYWASALGQASLQGRAEGKILDDLWHDPKTQDEFKKRGLKIAQETGIGDPNALPQRDRDTIGRSMMENIQKHKDEIVAIQKSGKVEEARETMLKAAEEGIRKGIELTKNSPAPPAQTSSSPKDEFNAAVRRAMATGDPAIIADAARRAMGAERQMPSPASVEDAASAAARGMAREVLERLKQGGGTIPTIPSSPSENPMSAVARLLSGNEMNKALEDRFNHIKEVTGRDPRNLPPQELVELKRAMAQEALGHAPEIAEMARTKGPDAARAEIAGIGERLIIEKIDRMKAEPPKPAPAAEARKPEPVPGTPEYAEAVRAAYQAEMAKRGIKLATP